MDQGTAQDFIEDLMQQIRGLEERFQTIEAITRHSQEQLRLARASRARWEGTANILAGEIADIMGTAEMYKRYQINPLGWAWEQTNGE